MSEQPTGVFVRLPLREDQRELMVDAAALGQPDDSHDKAILAIGTPVTGGELDYCAQIVWYEGAVEPEVAAWRNNNIKKGDNIKVVRQSDALAKLAEKDTEITRLRSALDEIEMGIDALPDELECGDRMTAREMQRQALIIVKEEMKALKGGAE